MCRITLIPHVQLDSFSFLTFTDFLTPFCLPSLLSSCLSSPFLTSSPHLFHSSCLFTFFLSSFFSLSPSCFSLFFSSFITFCQPSLIILSYCHPVLLLAALPLSLPSVVCPCLSSFPSSLHPSFLSL